MTSASSGETKRPLWTFGSTGACFTGPAPRFEDHVVVARIWYGCPSGLGPSFRSSKNPSSRGTPRRSQANLLADFAYVVALIVEHEHPAILPSAHRAGRHDELKGRLLIGEKAREHEQGHTPYDVPRRDRDQVVDSAQ